MLMWPKTTLAALLLVAVAVAALVAWVELFSFGADISHNDASPMPMPIRRSNHGKRRRLGAELMANQTILRDNYNRSLYDIRLERTTYKLPHAFEQNLMDWTNLSAEGPRGLPVFWHILKSGGTTIKLMYATCYQLVEACESGVLIGTETSHPAQPEQQAQLQAISDGLSQGQPSPGEWTQMQQQQQVDMNSGAVNDVGLRQEAEPKDGALEYGQQAQQPISSGAQTLSMSPWEWIQQKNQQQAEANNIPGERRRLQTQSPLRVVISEDGRKYVNIDTTTSEGIMRAFQFGFASSNLADVMFTPLLLESSEFLLNQNNPGRMFAIFRNPVERVVSIFYYLKTATWEPTYNPEYAKMTIRDFAFSPYCESNWMVRSLTNKMTGSLAPGDIEVAKEVLRRKCLVGLMDIMEESIVRFHAFFGFGNENALNCAKEQFARKGYLANSNKYDTLDENSDTYTELVRKNELDIRLYEYARQLFSEQGRWLKEQQLI